jgi:hypothetical protein
MARIKLGQTKLRLWCYVNLDLTDVDTVIIKYIKPSKKTGHWDAEIFDRVKGIVFYDVTKIDLPDPPTLNETGEWKRWVDATWSDDRHAEGDTITWTVYKPGT